MVRKQDMTSGLNGSQTISRKEALGKAGKYAAFTAAAMMLILDSSAREKLDPPPDRPPKKSPIKPRPRPV